MEFQLQHMVPLRRSQTLVSPELSLQHHNRRLAEAWGGCLGPELGSYKLFTSKEAGMSPLCHSSLVFLDPGVSQVTSIGGWHHVPNNERCSSVVADLESLVAVAAVFRLRNSEGKLRLKYALRLTHTH
jgi:hypothetical protein